MEKDFLNYTDEELKLIAATAEELLRKRAAEKRALYREKVLAAINDYICNCGDECCFDIEVNGYTTEISWDNLYKLVKRE